MKIAIIITGLSAGGAETMLLRLLEHIDRNRFSFHVFSLTGLGEIGPRIRALGIPVEAIGMKLWAQAPIAVFRLASRLREARADLVHTWMYHADLLGGCAARIAGVRAISWGIRNTNLDRDKTKLSTRIVVMCSALASRWLPTGILSNSEVARDALGALRLQERPGRSDGSVRPTSDDAVQLDHGGRVHPNDVDAEHDRCSRDCG